MDQFQAHRIPETQVQLIQEFITQKQSLIAAHCPNALIRDDIFLLLDSVCTVIYYPTNGQENNNGFHVQYPTEEGVQHFVYINTAQHKEKQIFTAAHELGHLWAVDKAIYKADSSITSEQIINRFAAELLMPKDLFIEQAKRELPELFPQKKAVPVKRLLQGITALMNTFFTSYKSVVYRLFELNIFHKSGCQILWGCDPKLPLSDIEIYCNQVAKEEGYTRLFQEDERKWIQGLQELLDTASAKEKESDWNKVSVSWLDAFYHRFAFETPPPKDSLEKEISLQNDAEQELYDE